MYADVPIARKERESQPRERVGSTGIGDEMIEQKLDHKRPQNIKARF
jgi:hypothetical protein